MKSAILNAASDVTQSVEKMYMENTLLRVAGALFCHDQKRAPQHIHDIQLNRGAAEKRIVIRPSPRYGQPGPLAHKIFVAIIKKHSGYGKPVQDEVSFTQRELGRLIGRTGFGRTTSEQIIRALSEIQNTFIVTGVFSEERQQWIEHTFNIFPEITIARRSEPSRSMEECSLVIARPIIASLKDNHFTCLNHALMHRLGTIAQALYMRLFFHFSNHYERTAGKNGLSFAKRYEDICAEWLGGLTVLKHKSKIIGEQLGSHLNQLKEAGFLSGWTIEPAASGEGFVLQFRPGTTFFTDYDHFYRHRHQGDLQWSWHADQRDVNEPLRVARIFQEKLSGAAAPLAFVSPKDVATARDILKHIVIDEIPAFVDYSLAEAKTTNFAPKTLGAIRQYVPGYRLRAERRSAAKKLRTTREAENRKAAEREAYDEFLRSSADALFTTLPPEEQMVIETLAAERSAPPPVVRNGSGSKRLFQIARASITLQRHPHLVPDFHHWRINHPQVQ